MRLAQSGGIGGYGLAAAGGAGAGLAAGQAAAWAKKTSAQAKLGMGLGIANTGISVVAGNNNNTEALNAANLVNTINSRLLTPAAATGTEVSLLKGDMGEMARILSRVASNGDPLTTAGLRNAPTLPQATTAITATTIPAATATTPASGFGNIGIMLLLGVTIYLVVKD